MDRVTYLDFDLLIQPRGKGYHTQVLTAPAGQAGAAFELPFSELELENFLLRIGRPRRSMRRIGSPEMEAAKTFGGRLFEALFGGEVRSAFRSSLDEAGRQHAGLRIRLRLADVPALHHLPWEFLYDPARHQFLVLSIETPLVRYLDLAERVRPLTVTPPIRVLVMISSPSDYPQLDVEQEWRKLHDALEPLEQRGLITLERLDQATLRALQRWLRRGACHIFHFIGHGGFDQASQDGLLILEDEHQRGRPVSGQDLGMLLHDHRLLRLAVLNACEGARTSQTDPFAGTAQSLVQHGIPAVIAMQFEITDAAAVTFAHEFYEAVADGYPVDAALAEARKAIFTQGNDVEWSTPVLYLRSPDGHIFDVERVPPAAVQPESNEERTERQNIVLFGAAQTAMAAENWAVAIEKLSTLLDLEPGHAEATVQLRAAQQQRELAGLYASGQQHAAAGRWHEALDAFRQVQARQGDYKEVSARIVAAQHAMAREELPLAPPVLPAAIPTATLHVPQARRIRGRWLRSTLALLLGVGGVLAWQNTLDDQPDPISLQPASTAVQAKTDKPAEVSPPNAEELYQKGEQYAKGQGVPKDEAEAIEWYRKAAAQGNTEAQNRLRQIEEAGREAAKKVEPAKPECPPNEIATLGKVVPLYVQWHKSRHAQWEEDEIQLPILEALAKEEEGQEGTARGRGAVFERMLPLLEAADAAKAARVKSGGRASVVLQELRAGTAERQKAVTERQEAFGLSFQCLSKYRNAIEYLTRLNQMPNFPAPMVNPEGEIGGFLGAYMRKHALVDHAKITRDIVHHALQAHKYLRPSAKQASRAASLALIEQALEKLDPQVATAVRQGHGEKALTELLAGDAALQKSQTRATQEYEEAYTRLATEHKEALSPLAPPPPARPPLQSIVDKAPLQEKSSQEPPLPSPAAAPPRGTPMPQPPAAPPPSPRNDRERGTVPENTKQSQPWKMLK